jgi:hypothetical protein
VKVFKIERVGQSFQKTDDEYLDFRSFLRSRLCFFVESFSILECVATDDACLRDNLFVRMVDLISVVKFRPFESIMFLDCVRHS